MSVSERLQQLFRRGHEREFLPAALEVVETPPSPIGRTVGAVIVLFFAVAVAWAFLGKVDILTTADGRILPKGEVKTIQPLDPGVVRAIHVQDGDHVRAGQVLIELDPTQDTADRDRVSADLGQARADVARLTALKTAVELGRAPQLATPAGVPSVLVEEARAAMRAQADQDASRVSDLTQQIAQKDAEIAEIQAQIAKINATLPMLKEKERIHHDLTEQGYGTSLSYLDAQQQAAEAEHELDVQGQKIFQIRAARAALGQQRQSVHAQYIADVLSDLRKAEGQQSDLAQELVKAQNKRAQTALSSPIDGVVDQLSVHTLNGVVTPAQHLMIVVPDSAALTIEARLANRDVGFIHPGEPVKVKIETFNFTRYGLVDGKVIDVSRDVISEDEASSRDPPTAGRTQRASAPSYVARIALSRTSMMVDGREEPLEPGMSVVAEIRTGERSVISYLLSPIARRAQDSLHER